MKILICGKGGSGKSTVSSLLAKAMAFKGFDVLVIDTDESNYGLHRQLGMELPGEELNLNLPEIESLANAILRGD